MKFLGISFIFLAVFGSCKDYQKMEVRCVENKSQYRIDHEASGCGSNHYYYFYGVLDSLTVVEFYFQLPSTECTEYDNEAKRKGVFANIHFYNKPEPREQISIYPKCNDIIGTNGNPTILKTSSFKFYTTMREEFDPASLFVDLFLEKLEFEFKGKKYEHKMIYFKDIEIWSLPLG